MRKGVLWSSLLVLFCLCGVYISTNTINSNAMSFIDTQPPIAKDIKSNPKTPRGWQLYWSDDFTSREIDDRYWTRQVGGNYWGNNELQYYTARSENCDVKNGKLIIRGLKEDFQNKQYTSARITTKGKIDFLYGRIDIKAKLPKGQGLFPAFWLLPSEENFSDRRKNGELDIMEMLGHEPRVIYGVAHYSEGNTYKSSGKYFNWYTNFSKDFHIFSLEWSPNELRWLIDNQPYYYLDLARTFKNSYKPYTKEFYLIMNLAIGGNWPGNPTDDKIFPATVEVDYVRYYKK